jgi:membrane protein YqaA with SNARE-associated domain
MLHRLVELVQPLAASFGGPGLAVLAFLDSSFLSFPEVPDVLIVWLVTRQPALWLYYSAMTTAGSVAGCYVLYVISRKGGEAFLRRRVRPRTLERSLAAIRRYGLVAVVIPSILPPPTPFKVFVILAGLSGIGPASFTGAVLIGRAFRYGAEALVAYRYGNEALAFLHGNLGRISVWLAVAVAVTAGAVALRRATRSR